ncbi:MAG: acyl-CoA reductase [Bacteroidales bacterium]|nr:acyl-CoA reductase [Bacteroidales bacterium]
MHTKASFITALARLGKFLRQFPDGTAPHEIHPESGLEKLNSLHFTAFSEILENEPVLNPWFTREALMKSLTGIAAMLEEEVLRKWLDPYWNKTGSFKASLTVGLILAGNIPLVGFHDILCVLASGHKVLAKPSSKDSRLIRIVAELLSDIDRELGNKIEFAGEKLTGMDAVIATGSNQSARYFEYYFRNIPHIIRKNRNGVAVLSGNESEAELAALGDDIFTYFGMGCRNVTKLYIPQTYDLKILLAVLDRFQHLYQHNKYGNNVDYYRTIYLMNLVDFLDNGILLLKEDPSVASPVGVVFYERYSDLGFVQKELELHKEEIQCVVSTNPEIEGAILPGSTQEPMPWDYADGVDTIRFLMELER